MIYIKFKNKLILYITCEYIQYIHTIQIYTNINNRDIKIKFTFKRVIISEEGEK